MGLSPRSVRRWRRRLEHDGYDGLFDRRRRVPSPKRAPVAQVQRLLALYRDRYQGFNVRHFHQLARRDHGVSFCYAFVKKALQTAGLVPRHRPRGRHRRRREPRPCFGERLHLDGSRHHWLPGAPDRWFTLIAVVDDATKQLLYAELWESGESVQAVMSALRAVLQRYGLPLALYTDRAHWAVHTAAAGAAPDRRPLTQVGRALARLGIEHILGFSPQARGRSERVNRTLQIGWSTSIVWPASPRWPRPTATCTPAFCRPSMPSSGTRRPIPPRPLCPSAPSIWIRSSASRKSAWSGVTTSSPPPGSPCSSPSSRAGAPVPASASSSGAI